MLFQKRIKLFTGKLNDIAKIDTSITVDLDNQESIERNLDSLTLYEIKSTVRDVDADFNGYPFTLTTAELLVLKS